MITEKTGEKAEKEGTCHTVFGFFKIGAFTFGGGYAMIPLIPKEAVDKYGWVSDSDILEIVAIAESTPGPIAVNMAAFAGSYGHCVGIFGYYLK